VSIHKGDTDLELQKKCVCSRAVAEEGEICAKRRREHSYKSIVILGEFVSRNAYVLQL
jgi:hypothetical protein